MKHTLTSDNRRQLDLEDRLYSELLHMVLIRAGLMDQDVKPRVGENHLVKLRRQRFEVIELVASNIWTVTQIFWAMVNLEQYANYVKSGGQAELSPPVEVEVVLTEEILNSIKKYRQAKQAPEFSLESFILALPIGSGA